MYICVHAINTDYDTQYVIYFMFVFKTQNMTI